MKRVFFLVLIVSFFAGLVPAFAEDDIPSLMGSWETVSCQVSHPQKGFMDSSFKVVIDEQKDRAFQGYFQFKSEGPPPGKEFVGHIAPDNKRLFGSFKRGVLIGEIVSEDELQLFMLKQGKEYNAVSLVLKRVK